MEVKNQDNIVNDWNVPQQKQQFTKIVYLGMSKAGYKFA